MGIRAAKLSNPHSPCLSQNLRLEIFCKYSRYYVRHSKTNQIFQSIQGSHVFSSTANTPLSFMNVGSSSLQNLQAAQEFQIPVHYPGSRAMAAAQQGVQIPLMLVSPKMGEAAAWQQPQQMTSLYKQVPVEIQVHTAQTIPITDWAD